MAMESRKRMREEGTGREERDEDREPLVPVSFQVKLCSSETKCHE
jgi:hypothetical protein